MPFRTLDDLDLRGKRVLVRVDLNVPLENGRVTDATRIERVLPTVREISQKGGRVVLLAHLGRPKARDPKASLKPIAEAASGQLGKPVDMAKRNANRLVRLVEEMLDVSRIETGKISLRRIACDQVMPIE